MSRQFYEDEAVRLLKKAEEKVGEHVQHIGYTPRAEQLANIAMVYARLAAIPAVEDEDPWRDASSGGAHTLSDSR